jgi:hypothetical protein
VISRIVVEKRAFHRASVRPLKIFEKVVALVDLMTSVDLNALAGYSWMVDWTFVETGVLEFVVAQVNLDARLALVDWAEYSRLKYNIYNF